MVSPELQVLLLRKVKADALSPEVRAQYNHQYIDLLIQIASKAEQEALPYWDNDICLTLLVQFLKRLAFYYELNEEWKNYIKWLFNQYVKQIDGAFDCEDIYTLQKLFWEMAIRIKPTQENTMRR
ncbi:hypothetical protein [Dehalobacter sp.]|uniref:hypothetical protein n=1 Tax=Dehalobacter sp. TaxID=1962289 RepID=UPI00258C7583|nr:hypothetical protein [Dehalobacter sp.]MDJ0305375.1 hypothetical protein [Dehalobacter sp.]